MSTIRNTIKISNPDLHDSQRTFLNTDVSWTWVTLTVTSTTWFWSISTATDYYYLLIGNYWDENAEIVLASDKTDTTFTVSALKYSHSSSEAVTYISYNQVKIYWRETTGWTNNILETLNIDCSQQYTAYESIDSTYVYFVSSFYREATTAEESDFSDEISASTFSLYSAKKIIEAWVKKAMTRIDENTNWVLSWDNLTDLLNEGLNEIITRKKQWLFLHKIDESISTVANTAYISTPDDLSIIDFIKVNWIKINYITKLRYNQYTNWSIVSSWIPCYWANKNNKVYLYPTPSSVQTVTYEYYSLPTVINSLTQEVNKEFATILIYFIAAHAAYIRGNEKRGDKMYVYYQQVLAQQIEDVTWYEQTWDAESIDFTSIYWWQESDFLI